MDSIVFESKMYKNLKRKITEEKMWSCVCGLIEPPDKEVEPETENANVNEIENNNDISNSDEPEQDSKEQNKVESIPKQFVATGSCKAELKITHISTDDDNKTIFPYEYSHKLPSLGIHYMSMSYDNKIIAAVSIDGTLHLIDVKKGIQMSNIGHNVVKNFFSAEFPPRSKDFIYAGCGNGHIYRYDTTKGKLQQSLDTNRLQCIISLCISPSGDYVACCDFDGYFTLFNVLTEKILNQTNYKKPMRRMVFNQCDGLIYAACDDKSVKIIEVPSGKLRMRLWGHNTWVMSIDLSPEGNRLVSGGFDCGVKIWDTRYTKFILTHGRNDNYNLWDVAFDKMNELVVSVADGKGLCVHYC